MLDVALVGVIASGVENHSLARLGQALTAGGLRHQVVGFGGFAGLERTIGEVLALQPRICGVSLQTTEAALATVTFTQLLRARGFAGTIVVGGHVASLAADDLLAASRAIDVVVELAGEQALVGLARGEPARDLPGTVTRAGRGRPPVAVQPRAMRRDRLSEHLGFGAADLIVSRGCEARCGYCCVAAVSDLAADHGDPRHVTTAAGHIADEIAELAERGGRAFHLMDDNILPLDPDAALAWARELRAALDARGVPPIAFSLQLRADVVTPAVAEALVDLGLVRAYVGIDGYSAGQLRAIGRAAPAAAGTLALAELSSRGVFCVANALLVGPTIRFDTIVAEVEALASVRHAPVHLLTIEARPGTVYHRRAVARGLIEGGMLWPIYRFEDPRAFLLAEVVTGLPTRLAERSVPIALYDLAWTLGVARRLAPELDLTAAAETYAAVTAAWNADQVRILRAAITAARLGPAAIAELLAHEQPIVRAHDEALRAACDRTLTEVERLMSALHRRPVRAHARGRVLGGIAISMGLASACGGGHSPATDAPAAVDAAVSCADTSRAVAMPQDLSCHCDDPAWDRMVKMTFDADGEVQTITGGNGQALPPDIEQCLLDLLAMYCYPAQAGTTQTFLTCHAWIA